LEKSGAFCVWTRCGWRFAHNRAAAKKIKADNAVKRARLGDNHTI
jgi:hypothetical protein